MDARQRLNQKRRQGTTGGRGAGGARGEGATRGRGGGRVAAAPRKSLKTITKAKGAVRPSTKGKAAAAAASSASKKGARVITVTKKVSDLRQLISKPKSKPKVAPKTTKDAKKSAIKQRLGLQSKSAREASRGVITWTQCLRVFSSLLIVFFSSA